MKIDLNNDKIIMKYIRDKIGSHFVVLSQNDWRKLHTTSVSTQSLGLIPHHIVVDCLEMFMRDGYSSDEVPQDY